MRLGGRALCDRDPRMNNAELELLRDVPLQVTAQIGSCRRTIAEILNLGAGSVLELDRQTVEPLDVLVNGTVIARGHIVAVDNSFGIQISQIVRERTP